MTPITHATLYDHPQFAAVLAQALTLARAKMPQFCGRLELAGALVGARAVTPGQGGTATVQSQSDPARTYHVSDHCTCDDAHYQAPEGWCKHRLAMALVTRVRQALQRGVDEANHCQVAIDDEGAPCEAVFAACPGHTVVAPGHAMAAPQGTALPEAPASVNVRVLLHGREVQLTLRDTDETRLLARLEAVLRQLPAEAPVSQILTPAHVAQTAAAPPMCKHHGAMKESSKAPGTWYCPKKLADGTYCTERWPAKRVA